MESIEEQKGPETPNTPEPRMDAVLECMLNSPALESV